MSLISMEAQIIITDVLDLRKWATKSYSRKKSSEVNNTINFMKRSDQQLEIISAANVTIITRQASDGPNSGS